MKKLIYAAYSTPSSVQHKHILYSIDYTLPSLTCGRPLAKSVKHDHYLDRKVKNIPTKQNLMKSNIENWQRNQFLKLFFYS